MMENDFDKEPELEEEQETEEHPPIPVWVNAGFGGRSYQCVIRSDSTMTLPEALVREMGMEPGDELDWSFDETEGVIYVKVIDKDWEVPEWLED